MLIFLIFVVINLMAFLVMQEPEAKAESNVLIEVMFMIIVNIITAIVVMIVLAIV